MGGEHHGRQRRLEKIIIGPNHGYRSYPVSGGATRLSHSMDLFANALLLGHGKLKLIIAGCSAPTEGTQGKLKN